MASPRRRQILRTAFLTRAVAFVSSKQTAAASGITGPQYVSLATFGGIPNDSTVDNTAALNAALGHHQC